MSPDDPRHKTTRGWHAGCRELCCRRAIAYYEKRTKHRRANGILWAIPALGTQRRIHALMALGWSAEQIAHAAGFAHRNRIWQITKGQKGKPTRYLERKTYRRIAEVYERMCMTLPPEETTGQRVTAARSRNLARRNGWAPPLAWDDIDNPDETPTGIYAKPADPTEWQAEHAARRAADLEHAVEHGRTLEQAADDLKITVKAIEKWCKRRERMDLIAALRKRSNEREMGVAS